MSGLIKHYQNTMQGIPQLTNNWGSMITLLDAVLITGFNHVPVISVSKSTPTAIAATINLGSNHGFIDRQVVRIAGSTNGWDGDYKVLSADSASILVECLPEQPSVANGMATCFTAPLDFEIVYQTPSESLKPKRAYRSANPESIGLILLVHDFCVTGAAAAGAKFAKVGVVSSMSDIDTITGTQMPFDSANPNSNWGWDGTNHGWAKWYYRTHSYAAANNSLADSTIAAGGASTFNVVSDGTSLCLDLYTGNQHSHAVYGVFEFQDEAYNESNLILLAHGLQGRIPESQVTVNNGRSGLVWQTSSAVNYGSPNQYIRGMLWFNHLGVANQTPAGSPLMLYTPGTTWYEQNINPVIFSDLLLVDNNNIPRGALPFLKTTTQNNVSQGVAECGKYINKAGYGLVAIVTRYAVLLESK